MLTSLFESLLFLSTKYGAAFFEYLHKYLARKLVLEIVEHHLQVSHAELSSVGYRMRLELRPDDVTQIPHRFRLLISPSLMQTSLEV